MDRWARRPCQKYPGSFPHITFHDPKGGHGIIDRGMQADGWKWIRKQKRDPYPRRVLYQTYWLRYDGAYWAHIDTLEDAAAPARIDAELQEGGGLRVKIDNADRFHLDLARQLVGDVKDVAVAINGGVPLARPAGKLAFFAKIDGKWTAISERYPPGLVKKHGLSGPVMDGFMGEPVLMVYGTVNSPDKAKSQKMIDDAVTRLFGAPDGGGVLHSGFERKADKDINQEDITQKNLGAVRHAADQIQIVARIADKLPVKPKCSRGSRGRRQVLPRTGCGPEGTGVSESLNPERYVLFARELRRPHGPLLKARWQRMSWNFPDYIVGQIRRPAGWQHHAYTDSGQLRPTWRP